MAELIEQYLERFHENFPLFALMGVEEAEVKAIIQDCLDKGTPTGHLNWMKNPYIDDLTTPAFGRWWFFHTIFAVSRWWAVNRTGENRGS